MFNHGASNYFIPHYQIFYILGHEMDILKIHHHLIQILVETSDDAWQQFEPLSHCEVQSFEGKMVDGPYCVNNHVLQC